MYVDGEWLEQLNCLSEECERLRQETLSSTDEALKDRIRNVMGLMHWLMITLVLETNGPQQISHRRIN